MKNTFLIACATAATQAHSMYNKFPEVDGNTYLIDQVMGNGVCQAIDGYDLFNLQTFDKVTRDQGKHVPAVQKISDGKYFVYKSCGDFEMKSDYLSDKPTLTNCDGKKSSAFLVDQGECKETFDNAIFTPHKNPDAKDTDETDNNGFNLNWKSTDKKGDAGFEFTITAICAAKDADPTNIFTIGEETTTSATLNFEGYSACPKTIALQKYFDLIAPYVGFIFIAIGLVMTLFGSKFILYVFSMLVGLLVGMIIFGIAYNKILDDYTSTKGAIITTLLVCALFAGLFGFLAYKFLKNWAIAVIASWGGIAIFVPLSKLVGLKGNAPVIAAAVLGAVIGFYVGKKFNVYVRSIGTAIIGSFLFTRGLGSMIGNYPSSDDLIDMKYNPAIIGYAACMVVVAIGGSVFQIRQNRDIPEDEMFEGEDEGKSCC